MRRIRIGRSETNDIVIPDASVSRQHAEAEELGGGRFSLSDLGSTFGTQVWQGQGWVAAKDTEIDADTVIRFGEFRTTLRDVLSEADRMALGLSRAAPPATPAAAAPVAPVAPPARPSATAADPPAAPKVAPRAAAADAPPSPRLQPAERPPAERAQATRDARAAARPVRSAVGDKRRAMVLGLMATVGFFAVAACVVVVALTFGDPGGAKPRPDARTAGDGPQRFLEACKTSWGLEERRCRCYLAAAGPHLEPADYDDFTTLVQGHVEGNSTQMESVLQQAGEKRGATAGARLSAAMKGVTRDCQAEAEPQRQ